MSRATLIIAGLAIVAGLAGCTDDEEPFETTDDGDGGFGGTAGGTAGGGANETAEPTTSPTNDTEPTTESSPTTTSGGLPVPTEEERERDN